MKIDSRTFNSGRYRALYCLLPIANGAVVEAGHYILRRMSGGALVDVGIPPDVASFLIDSGHFIAALLIPGLVICSLEIFLLGQIYRRNVFPFAFRRLLTRQDDDLIALPFVGPLLLTVTGGIAVVAVLRLLSIWVPAGGGLSSTGIAFATVFLYIPTVVPVLTHCEQAAGERANGDAEEVDA